MRYIVRDIWNVLPRRARWVTGTLLVLWLGWTWLFQERYGGASIVVHSVIDRPISYVSVNGKMGGNTPAFNGLNTSGGTTGPWLIEGDTVKIEWELDMTEKQAKEGLKFEKHVAIMPMPRRDVGEDDFCVLFLPNNKVITRWVKSCHLDMDDLIEPFQVRKRR
ncbi:hypothetical protein M1D83_09950 [Enterobacteriaceae bacterium]